MKNIFLKCLTWAAFSFIAFLAFSCQPDPEPDGNPVVEPGQITLDFDNVINNGTINLHAGENVFPYTNANGDQFEIAIFRYYISNIVLKKADGTEYKQPESYHLIDESKPATQLISIKDIPAGEYTSLSFMVGVDSTRNVSGAQAGALDPANGMFWSWNTGYIFMKLEGKSPQSPNGNLTYHVGGFRKVNNALRTISPTLNGQKIRVQPDKNPEVHIKVEVQDMFRNPAAINFANLSFIMSSKPEAAQLATNYADMFKIDHIHN